jgi:hypothetical protein
MLVTTLSSFNLAPGVIVIFLTSLSSVDMSMLSHAYCRPCGSRLNPSGCLHFCVLLAISLKPVGSIFIALILRDFEYF